MTGAVKQGFSEVAYEKFGEERATVVHHCKSGRGIRYWDKDYRFPDNYVVPGKGPPSDKAYLQHGTVYPALIEAVRQEAAGKAYNTFTFIWMQGESDAGRAMEAAYAESFMRLVKRLKSDLGVEEMNFVIGRLSDAKPDDIHWQNMRQVQVELAEAQSRGAWVDTDDLNRSPSEEKQDLVHYPGDKAQILGKRFAERAIKLVTQHPGETQITIQPGAIVQD